MREYCESDDEAPYRALAVAIIEQCRKDARGSQADQQYTPRLIQHMARHAMEHSDVIKELCELLDLPHAAIVQKVCYDEPCL